MERRLRVVFFGEPGSTFSLLHYDILKRMAEVPLFVSAPTSMDAGPSRASFVSFRDVCERVHARLRGDLASIRRLGRPLTWMTRPRRLPLAAFSDPGLMQRLADIDPDLLISAGFGRIIPAGMLAIPRMGAFNCHPSPLPRYAGRNPWFWMLNKGETEGGVTIHRMVSAVDAGPIAAQTTFPIRPDMNFQDLYNLTSILSARMLRGWLRRWPGGVMGVSEQDLSLRTYFSGPEKNDYRIVWNSPAETIDNLVRAANPRPAAWTSFGNTRVRVIKIAIGAGGFGLAALPQGTDAPPGRVTHVDGNGVWVSCADGTVGIRLARVRGTEARGMRLARLLGIAPGAQLK